MRLKMRRIFLSLLFVGAVWASGCGKNEITLWYYFGEIHDYHFRNLLNRLWKQFPFSVVPT